MKVLLIILFILLVFILVFCLWVLAKISGLATDGRTNGDRKKVEKKK